MIDASSVLLTAFGAASLGIAFLHYYVTIKNRLKATSNNN